MPNKLTVLHAACKGELVKMKEYVSSGCDVNTVHDFTGRSAIQIAIANHNTDIAQFLLNQPEINMDMKDILGETTLMKACIHNLPTIIELLINKGAALNNVNNHGDSALHLAVVLKNTHIVQLLLEENIDFTLKNNDGKMAKDIAEKSYSKALVSILEKHEELQRQKYEQGENTPRNQTKPGEKCYLSMPDTQLPKVRLDFSNSGGSL